jgi:hypothetical protein
MGPRGSPLERNLVSEGTSVNGRAAAPSASVVVSLSGPGFLMQLTSEL